MGRVSESVLPVPSTAALVADEPSPWAKHRVILAFWLLGMCNNYVYVIMLSAAHDVISKVEEEVRMKQGNSF